MSASLKVKREKHIITFGHIKSIMHDILNGDKYLEKSKYKDMVLAKFKNTPQYVKYQTDINNIGYDRKLASNVTRSLNIVIRELDNLTKSPTSEVADKIAKVLDIEEYDKEGSLQSRINYLTSLLRKKQNELTAEKTKITKQRDQINEINKLIESSRSEFFKTQKQSYRSWRAVHEETYKKLHDERMAKKEQNKLSSIKEVLPPVPDIFSLMSSAVKKIQDPVQKELFELKISADKISSECIKLSKSPYVIRDMVSMSIDSLIKSCVSNYADVLRKLCNEYDSTTGESINLPNEITVECLSLNKMGPFAKFIYNNTLFNADDFDSELLRYNDSMYFNKVVEDLTRSIKKKYKLTGQKIYLSEDVVRRIALLSAVLVVKLTRSLKSNMSVKKSLMTIQKEVVLSVVEPLFIVSGTDSSILHKEVHALINDNYGA